MTPAQIEAYVDAAAAALALPIAAEHRPGVLFYFALAASMADVVAAVPMGPHDEPAPAFAPISPPASAPGARSDAPTVSPPVLAAASR